ncbi:MAG: EamA family transporter [Gammaproteobacteria bacterium]|nr:EamA family transporter [Gammaproteobacteria bacterium]
MILSAQAVALVLLAALLHAAWNATVKVGGDRLAVLAIANATGFVICLSALPFLPLPAAASWPFLIASALLHTGYYFFLVRAYEVGDLSHVYPLARGLSPLLVVAVAAIAAGELLPPLALAGVALAALGIASLAFESGPPWRHARRPLFYACATAAFIAAYTVADGMGVRRAGNALAYIAWLGVLDGLPIMLAAWYRRRRVLVATLGASWRKGCATGVLQLAAYGLVIWAMGQGTMAAVSALRETSVIFAALIGAFVLRERFGGVRIAAAVIVACGLILMRVG